jgi:ribosome-binding factor A
MEHDPRSARRKWADIKTLRLCGQAARTFNLFLSGCGDGVLQSLIVDSVDPGPDPSWLLVTVIVADLEAAVNAAEILEHLDRARGLLRSELAAAIRRKRTPNLMFRLMCGS